MNILITGASGLLGRELVKWLSQENNIFAIARDNSNNNFESSKNITVINMDLTNIDTELLPKNIDVVYYLAQSNRFREFPDGIDDMLSINVIAPNILAKWAVQNNVKKFIYASSGGVYTSPDIFVKESVNIDANEKLGFYLNSKLSAEMLLRNYANYFETFVIVRPFFIYGTRQNKTMLIPRLISNVQNMRVIKLNDQEGIKINPIYVDDATRSMIKILSITGEYVINIAGKEVISLKRLVEVISQKLSIKANYEYSNTKQNDLVADITLMNQKLCEPLVSINEGIDRMLNSI